MGKGLKRARAAARATQTDAKVWAVQWRGKITRDVGTDYEKAMTILDAKMLFKNRYPMREIVAVTKSMLEEGHLPTRPYYPR